MQTVIEFKNFSYKYRTQADFTLKNINLEIHAGEKVLIIGASGSGKSTLLKCLNGLCFSGNSGSGEGILEVCGKNPQTAGVFEMSKCAGTVLQDSDGQFVGLTVAEDIAFALENENADADFMKKKVSEAAKIVEMENFLKSAPNALSGGQKQRVSLAGVLVDDVEILLFDEPLANLDPASGKKTVKLIDELNKKQGKTVLVIEHRLEDALYCGADRIILMDSGKIIADTTPDEILCTNLLTEHGIREPLYIAALKYSGAQIKACDNPSDIEKMNLEPYKKNVCEWFKKNAASKIAVEAENVLEMKNISFAYEKEQGQNPVLNDVSFSVKKGEMLSIVGTNGAGKSTAASLICGFLSPDKGEILLNGKNISNLSIKQRGEHIGFVLQNQNQMISKPMIYDEVALGLSVRKVSKEEIKERVYEALKICGLYPFRNWPVSAVSFGQKKRVTIASILALNPEIIILDEPTAGQDYAHYTEVMEFLRKLNREQGITIIMITHDMHLMLEYTDRAVVFSKGRIVADDECSKILTDENIIKSASLKKTSLYDLSKKCGIENPCEFVDCFINYERSQFGKERRQ
jgi:energy-coupling factor transport system ATP-binding protein